MDSHTVSPSQDGKEGSGFKDPLQGAVECVSKNSTEQTQNSFSRNSESLPPSTRLPLLELPGLSFSLFLFFGETIILINSLLNVKLTE